MHLYSNAAGWYIANPVPVILLSTAILVAAPFVAYLLHIGKRS